MPSSYTRDQIRPDCVKYTVTPGWTPRPVSAIPPIAAGVIFGLLVFNSSDEGFFSHLFHLVFGIGLGWGVFRGVKWWMEKKAATPFRTFSFTISGDGVLTEEGRVIQKQDVTELRWTNFSLDGSASNECSLYCEVADRNQSPLLATGLDEATAKRLTADAAKILGVPFDGGTAEHTKTVQGVNDLETLVQLAQDRFEKARKGIGTTSDQQPLQPGDTIIKETRRNVFGLYRQSETGRDFLIDLDKDPHRSLFLAEDQAGTNSVWYEKPEGGPAILIPRAKPAEERQAARDNLLQQLQGEQKLSPAEEEKRAKAKQKLAEMRAKFAQDIITTAMQPMATDDLVLSETSPGIWEILQVKAGGREKVIPVPFDDLAKVIQFAETYADGRNMWLEKLADKGPAVLMVRADTSLL